MTDYLTLIEQLYAKRSAFVQTEWPRNIRANPHPQASQKLKLDPKVT
jgi:hypothetical protein